MVAAMMTLQLPALPEAPPAGDLHSPDSSPDSPEFSAFHDDVPHTADVDRLHGSHLGVLERDDGAQLSAACSLAPFGDEDAEWTFLADRGGPIWKPPHLRWEPDVTAGAIDPPPGTYHRLVAIGFPRP
ncbi:hypothetical protein CYMTET_24865 [Cymbomonas tetramitiformis]|uniref:Uncharacterized protein n=1 Tax=Cymbomonas tetramitiformis TaxID=36881 RepID=A0AAE0FUZ1_9CHLO|nr:hypothetical protein CYMTET_24865 [Cymbomonas tetramitiformis]